MRPPAETQDPLRTPLNQAFGSEGSVRVLRVLAFAREPIGRTTVARRAELDPSGVRRTLDGLAEMGLVEAIGSGRNQSVRLRDRHPLSSAIRSLFEAERSAFQRFVTAAREAFNEIDFPARAVWLENPEARAPGTVHVGVLSESGTVDRAREVVRTHLEEVEQELATHFVVHAYTDADCLAMGEEAERLRELTLLHGWLPQEWHASAGGPVQSHRTLDERAQRLAMAIAEELPKDPSIIDRTMRWIDGRSEDAGAREARNLEEWRRILEELSIQQIQALLREDSERANRMRQSLPFTKVLTPAERERLLTESSS